MLIFFFFRNHHISFSLLHDTIFFFPSYFIRCSSDRQRHRPCTRQRRRRPQAATVVSGKMSKEESFEVSITTHCSPESRKKRAKIRKNKKKQLLMEGVDVMEMKEVGSVQLEESNINSDCDKVKTKTKRKKSIQQCVEESSIKDEAGEYQIRTETFMKEGSPFSDGGSEKFFEKRKIALEDAENERTNIIVRENSGEKILESNNGKADQRNIKRKKRLLKEAANADMRGICYLSRVPPHMDPLRLRQILSQYGEIQRIYLAPEDAASQVQRKRAGGFRGQFFSEGWVEFTDKRVAMKVAKMLNGEQIGGRKRSSFYYDLWNIKYLSKFKWDDLTEETAYKHAIREQKLALEISAAKRERDFYLAKVDKSRALNSIEERLKKKQKLREDSEMNSTLAADSQKLPKLIRSFPQTQPVADSAVQNKQRLSTSVLAGVFGSS